MPGVGLQAGAGQQDGLRLPVVADEFGPAGRVGDEAGGVHLGGQHLAVRGQRDPDPVVGLVAAPPGLPAVAHDGGPAGRVQVVRRGVVPVGGGLGDAAVLLRGQVEGQPGEVPRVGQHLAVHPQPGDAAVRPDVQPDVRVPGGVGDREGVRGVAAQRGPRHQVGPLGGQHLLGRGVPGHRRALYGRRLRVVAGEVRGVHHHAAHHARRAEPDDRPVVVLVVGVRLPGADAAPAAGLPAVHDLALVPEGVRAELGGRGDQQVLGVGEGVLVGGDHPGAEQPGGQVDQLGERCVRALRGAHLTLPHSRTSCRPRGAPSTSTACPRSQVVRTCPVRVRPA